MSAKDVLTAKTWRLFSFGFDSNNNGKIDADEEAEMDCEKDDTYMFHKDGSGIINENQNVCSGNPPSSQFTWELRDNDSVLDFHFGIAYITKLNADSLYLVDSNTNQVKLLFIYGH